MLKRDRCFTESTKLTKTTTKLEVWGSIKSHWFGWQERKNLLYLFDSNWIAEIVYKKQKFVWLVLR